MTHQSPAPATLGARLALVLRENLAELAVLPRNVLVNVVAASDVVPTLLRIALYRLGGLRVAWRARVSAGVRIAGGRLVVAPNSTVNAGCLIDCHAEVRIGERCGIGYGVSFVTSSHHTDDPDVRAGVGRHEPIVIGDAVFIGAGAVILGGVTIGRGCVVAAGSVVTGDCEADHLYGGVPARALRALPT